MNSALSAARAAPRTAALSGTWRADLCHSAGSIRLHCPAQPAGEPLLIEPQLTTAERATRFVSRQVGEILAAKFFPHLPVEIVRVDA